MLLFWNEEHIDRWCARWNQPRGAVLTLDQTWRLASFFYGAKLQPDWRRATLDEVEALFAEAGLTGQFWNLR